MLGGSNLLLILSPLCCLLNYVHDVFVLMMLSETYDFCLFALMMVFDSDVPCLFALIMVLDSDVPCLFALIMVLDSDVPCLFALIVVFEVCTPCLFALMMGFCAFDLWCVSVVFASMWVFDPFDLGAFDLILLFVAHVRALHHDPCVLILVVDWDAKCYPCLHFKIYLLNIKHILIHTIISFEICV